MTPAQFKACRKTLCLTQRELAEVWGMGQNGNRDIGRWERGEVRMNPIAAYCISLMIDAGSDREKHNGE